VLNRHGLERIFEFRAAVTAHFVGLAMHCEHAAEVTMVTPEEEIEDCQEDRHKLSLVLSLGNEINRVTADGQPVRE